MALCKCCCRLKAELQHLQHDSKSAQMLPVEQVSHNAWVQDTTPAAIQAAHNMHAPALHMHSATDEICLCLGASVPEGQALAG